MTEKKENVVANINGGSVTLPINATTSSTYTISNVGSGGTNWTSPNTNWSSSTGTSVLTIPHGENKVIVDEAAALEVKGKMIINGVDLEERLSIIEKLLNIPTRDAKLEEKYIKLQDLYEQYTKALEEYKTWERLKNSK